VALDGSSWLYRPIRPGGSCPVGIGVSFSQPRRFHEPTSSAYRFVEQGRAVCAVHAPPAKGVK